MGHRHLDPNLCCVVHASFRIFSSFFNKNTKFFRTMTSENEEKILLPHHEQQELCKTRLPYRQGRKLTAVKVYTVNNESNHLLIFGVPSLNLRQETKALFGRFGKLTQFKVSPDHAAEQFTETYHAVYEKIQSARIAKRMLDTKNFYGSSLHVCYAPEYESSQETRQKLFVRQRDVMSRLKTLEKEVVKKDVTPEETVIPNVEPRNKMNMGHFNVIGVGQQIRDVVLNKNKRKCKDTNVVIEKKFKPCFVTEEQSHDSNKPTNSSKDNVSLENEGKRASNKDIEIIDFTSTEHETLTNINEHLNYDTFGNEVIRKVPEKPLNKIKFNIGNKNLI